MPLHGAKITVLLDEIVTLLKINQNLIVNPVSGEPPEVTARGKIVTIEFSDKLKDSTTYLLQFKKAIADIHEGNTLESFNYIFSTGNHLDSASLTGKITDALTNLPIKDIRVCLYDTLRDSIAFKSRPCYMSISDDKGNYFLPALKADSYIVMAFQDKNKDMIYQAGETVAFLPNPIFIHEDTINLKCSTPRSEKSFITKKIHPFCGFDKYVMNDTSDKYGIIPISGFDTAHYLTYIRTDTLEVCYIPQGVEATFLVMKNSFVLDTQRIQIPDKNKIDSAMAKKQVLRSARTETPTYHLLHDPIHIIFPVPLNKIQNDLCYFLADSIRQKLLLSDSEENSILLPPYMKCLKNSLAEQKKYQIVFLPGALQDFWGTSNKDTIQASFKTLSGEDYGSLIVKLQLADRMKHIILQLLDGNSKLVRQITAEGDSLLTFNFYNISPGNYSLKLIYDLDADKKFTPANAGTKQQPEPVFYCEKPINLLAGWDVETSWNLRDEKK